MNKGKDYAPNWDRPKFTGSRRQCANDWINLGGGTSYSQELNLWFKDGMHYDEVSAHHNGIAGIGRHFAELLSNRADRRMGSLA